MKTYQKLIISVLVIFASSQLSFSQNLFDTIDEGDIEKIRLLIKEDPECTNKREKKSGYTPLLRAASKDQIDICKLLIENGADIHTTDNLNGTALHIAAYHRHPKLIKLFIDLGIDVNTQDNNGYTPIVWAVSGKSIEVIDELIEHGANINPPIRIGRSILHLAAANSNPEVIKYLLNKGIKINSRSDYGNTPLFWALRSRKYDNTKFLIENGADLEIQNNAGFTPLSFSLSINDVKMVKLLSQYGVDIHETNSLGDTHLHAAAYHGNKEMVSFLLEKGVNPNIANIQGLTALDLAISRHNQGVEQLLHSAGAKSGKGKKINRDHFNGIREIGLGLDNQTKVTIVYDNYSYQDGLGADWGFSCLIEGIEKNILFDTGTKSDLLLNNIEKLDIDPGKVDIIVLSHEHGDHTGGLFPFLEINHDLSVIMPYSFSYNFIRRVETLGAKAITVENPVEICKDVYLSGELILGRITEQALAINTQKGLIIICGCAHPGILKIIKKFKETLNRNVYLVLGGFHLMNNTDQEVREIINQMKELGVQKCGASHCTGTHQIQLFEEEFGDDYIPAGVGNVITLN